MDEHSSTCKLTSITFEIFHDVIKVMHVWTFWTVNECKDQTVEPKYRKHIPKNGIQNLLQQQKKPHTSSKEKNVPDSIRTTKMARATNINSSIQTHTY